MNKLALITAVSLISFLPAAASAQEPQQSEKVHSHKPIFMAQANPWDKYDSEPVHKTNSSESKKADENTKKTESRAEAEKLNLKNPWDKYQEEPAVKASKSHTPAAAEETPINNDLPADSGLNPWDKYTPAPSSASKNKKNVAKVKERPQKLELAVPLKQPEIPQGKRVIKNDLPVGTDNYFAVEYADQLVGYSQFKINRLIALGGTSTYVMESASRIKLGVHNIQDLKFTSNSQIDKKTLTPNMFLCAQGDLDTINSMSVNCIYSENFIAQNNSYDGKTQGYIEKFTKESRPSLIFNNLWGHLDTFAEHYWLLVRSAAEGGVVDTYDPILQGTGKTIVYAPIKESWKDKSGIPYTTYLYKITDINSSPLAYVRLNAKDSTLLEIREIGTGFTFRRSTKGVLAAVEKTKGQRIKANSELSNIYFQDPEKLLRLEAFADLHLRSSELAQHELNNYSQKFYGTIEEGHINGRFVVNSTLYKNEPKAKFPFTEEIPEDLKKYTKPSPGIELEVNALKTKALEIAWKSESAFQAAQRLTGYIANQINEGVALPSARQTLENKTGNPESKALLLTAWLRALNIPAKCVGGLAYRGDSFASHYWTEAWLGPEDGWVQFDPTTNESGFINASHITLWESGDLQAMDVVVEKFLPRPPRTADYFKTDLKWPIGEKRSYSIYQDGNLIGLETAHMYDMEMTPSGENYKLNSDAVIMRSENPMIFQSTLTVNEQGLPAAFTALEDDSKEVYHTDFTFKGTNITQTLNDKPDKSPKRPEKSQALLAKEKEAAEKASEENLQEDKSAEADIPKPEAVNIPDIPQNQDKEESSQENKQLAHELDSAANGDSASEAGENTQNQELSSEASENDGEADEEAKKQEKIQAEQQKRSKLQEIRECYYEGLEAEKQAKAEAEAKAKDEKDQNGQPEEKQKEPEYKQRQIPFSFGTYLIDQRFLSQWAMVIEQSPAVVPEKDESKPESSAAPAEKIDPNLGVISKTEEIRHEGSEPEAAEKPKADETAAKEAAGETGAGTFSKNDDLDDSDQDSYTFQAFIPGSLKIQEITIQRADSDESVTMPNGEEIEAARLDTEKGMIFYLDLKTGKVIKISIPSQKLEMYLDKTEFKL